MWTDIAWGREQEGLVVFQRILLMIVYVGINFSGTDFFW